MSDNDLSYDEAMRIAQMRARHLADQMAAGMNEFATALRQVGVAFAEAFVAGLKPFHEYWRAMHADPRTRAMLATRESFEAQYAKQRMNKRRRDRRRT